MKIQFRTIRILTRETLEEWREDGGASIAAALAYYAVFSLSPLLLLFALFLGLLIGQGSAQDQLLQSLETTFGQDSVGTFSQSVQQNNQQRSNLFAIVIWLAVVIWGASGVFGQLQLALNRIWEVRASADRPFWVIFKNRLLSFTVVMIAGILLLLSIGVNTVLSSVDLGENLFSQILLTIIHQGITLIFVTFLIGWIFKVLPDIYIRWKDVLVGAMFTAVLFMIGQAVVGIYLRNSNVGSVYGAAGSLTIILVWIYYSAQILFFGAEFTEVWARHHGVAIRPDADSEWIDVENAAREIAEAAAMTGRMTNLADYDLDEDVVSPSDKYQLNIKSHLRHIKTKEKQAAPDR